MSDVLLASQEVVRGGLAASYTGSLLTTNTYQVPNDGRVILHVKKSGAGSCDITITTFPTVDGAAVADRVVVIPATTGDKFIGPFPQDVYNDPTNGCVEFTASEITGLTVAALRF